MQEQVTNRNGAEYLDPVEDDLYKRIELFGKAFELRYGYYEERDRKNPLVKPIPIYPDFRKSTVYTEEGYPFVTDMQDTCEHYAGDDPDAGCYCCRHYRKGEDFIGVCLCESNRKNE